MEGRKSLQKKELRQRQQELENQITRGYKNT